MRKLLLYFFTLALFYSSLAEAANTRGVGPLYFTLLNTTSGNDSLASTTAGRSIICTVFWYDPADNITISSIAVSGESNMSLIAGSKFVGVNAVGDVAGQIAYLANNTGGGSKTITITFSGATYADLACMEYAGLDTSSQPDASTNTSGSAGTATTSLVTTTNNALIVAAGINTSGEYTAGSGYTLFGGGGMPNTMFYEETEDNLDAGSAGSKTVAFTGFGSDWVLTAASFKTAGGGGGGGGGGGVAHRRIQ